MSGHIGPTVAHDGRLTWMLMWVNGPEIQFKVGVGGRTASAGIEWEQTPTIGVLPVMPDESPALAYGDGRWVAVFRRAGGGLFVVRSAPTSLTTWSAPAAVTHAGTPPIVATSMRGPALAFGRVAGRDVFVLVYVHPTLGAVAATSPDGLTWSAPASIAVSEKTPAVVARNGSVWVLLSRTVSATGAAGSYSGFVFHSRDGATWREIGAYPRAANNVTGAGMAYGACSLVIAEAIGGALGGGLPPRISIRHGVPAGPCGEPTGFSVGDDEDFQPGLAVIAPPSVGNSNARISVAFAGPPDPPPPRRLLITEWFPGVLELHLAEPPDVMLDLTGLTLEVRARSDRDSDPTTPEPDHIDSVALVGSMRGGDFLVVFEGFLPDTRPYEGPPVLEMYVDAYNGMQGPGLKIEGRFFGWDLGGASTALRVSGASIDGTVDDVLLVGRRPRLAIGGRFVEDTAQPVLPTAPDTLRRLFDAAGPIDTDRESDWRPGGRSFGAANR